MADGRSGHGAQIAVALIGVTGVIGAAVISNWDKIFGRADARTVDDRRPAVPDRTRDRDDTAAPPAEPAVATAAPLPAVPEQMRADTANLSGWWIDTDKFTYRTVHTGATFETRQYQAGIDVGGGTGEISGRIVTYRFDALNRQGECRGEIAPDAKTVEGFCTVGGPPWRYRLTRMTGDRS